MTKLRPLQVISLAILGLGVVGLFFDRQEPSHLSQFVLKNDEVAMPQLVRNIDVPVLKASQSAIEAPQVSGTAVYVMDRASGSILFQKNSDEARYPASTAKMMTALLARRLYKLDDIVTVKEEAFSTGSSGGLALGEQLTVEQLLYAMLVPSGNDAAFVLANHHPLGYAGFVAAMNTLARELHLNHSTFYNPSGLDRPDQVTSAHDLALIAHEVMKDELLRKIVATKVIAVHDITATAHHPVTNTNELLGVLPGIIGIKTGTTTFAGENYVADYVHNNHDIIIVILGSKDRFKDALSLIDWLNRAYEWQHIN